MCYLRSGRKLYFNFNIEIEKFLNLKKKQKKVFLPEKEKERNLI